MPQSHHKKKALISYIKKSREIKQKVKLYVNWEITQHQL